MAPRSRELRSGQSRARLIAAAALAVGLACATALEPEQPADESLREADAELATGAVRAAESAYRAALRRDPQNGRAAAGLVRALLELGEPERALESGARFRVRVGAAAARAVGLDQCAVLAHALRHRLAKAEARSALELGARFRGDDCARPGVARLLAEAHRLEAGRLRARGALSEALTHYRHARERDPSALESWLAGAEILVQTGRRDEAIGLLSAALERHPGDRTLQTLMVAALGMRYPRPARANLAEPDPIGDDHEREP